MDSTPSDNTTTTTTTNTTPVKSRRGFAAMSPERRKELAAKGGVAAHKQGKAHKFTSEKAREAGRKGGIAPHVRRGRGPVTAAE